MNFKKIKNVMMLVLLVFVTQFAFAQKTLELQNNPELKVSGTSSLHDWEMPSNTATGTMTAADNGSELTQITALFIEMPSESIKSGKKGMDKKAYDALNTKNHKSITFKLDKAAKEGNVWILDGEFNIAGTAKKTQVKATESGSSGAYTLTGSYDFNLTDYGIKPPTAVMGTIKTGDAVKIAFKVTFK